MNKGDTYKAEKNILAVVGFIQDHGDDMCKYVHDRELNTFNLQINSQAFIDLDNYLRYHEQDIAWGIDDFYELRCLFRLVYGREPEKESASQPNQEAPRA